jgi:outer membrane protein TolC
MNLPTIPDLFPANNQMTKTIQQLQREYVEAVKQARSLRKRLETANQCVAAASKALDSAVLEMQPQRRTA